MSQCINKDYINIKMKMRGFQYTFNDLDLDTYCQDNNPEQHSKGFNRQSLGIKKLLIKNVNDSSLRVQNRNLYEAIQL